jgi:hypothetical protein
MVQTLLRVGDPRGVGLLTVICGLAVFAYIMPICPAQMGTAQTVVEGHVYYKSGAPVDAALVDFRCFCPVGAILPPPTHTDKHGSFTLRYVALGDGWLTASKESEGFPDATVALYGRNGYASYTRVSLREGAPIHDVNLHFGVPDAILQLRVEARGSKLPIPKARVIVQWPEDRQTMISTAGLGENGMFLLVLPKHRVSITVSAPDFDIWHYQDQKNGVPYILAPPGSHVGITADLRPSSLRLGSQP